MCVCLHVYTYIYIYIYTYYNAALCVARCEAAKVGAEIMEAVLSFALQGDAHFRDGIPGLRLCLSGR